MCWCSLAQQEMRGVSLMKDLSLMQMQLLLHAQSAYSQNGCRKGEIDVCVCAGACVEKKNKTKNVLLKEQEEQKLCYF